MDQRKNLEFQIVISLHTQLYGKYTLPVKPIVSHPKSKIGSLVAQQNRLLLSINFLNNSA